MLRSGYVSIYAKPNTSGLRCEKCNTQPSVSPKKLGIVVHNVKAKGKQYNHLCKICASDLLRGQTPRVLNRMNDYILNDLIEEAYTMYKILEQLGYTKTRIKLGNLEYLYEMRSITNETGYRVWYSENQELNILRNGVVKQIERGQTHMVNAFVLGFNYQETGVLTH